MILAIIISLLIGYFLGLISCISQVLIMEAKYNKKLKEIVNDEKNN